jgi:DNA-3-methyladenine glycosylase
MSKNPMANKRRYSVVRCTTIKCSSAVALKPQIPAKRHLLLTTIYGQPPSLQECFMPRTLGRSFFGRSVHEVAPELVGATLLFAGVGGRVVEVEAYHQTDPAAHSFRGQTARNAVMFGPPGFAYVYRSYGIHWCLNFVCEPKGSASAVLIRALEPTAGVALMRRRRGLAEERLLCSGPGRLCEALGITGAQNGLALDRSPFAILARTEPTAVIAGPRIGITKAVERPWRYGLKGSRFLSKPMR